MHSLRVLIFLSLVSYCLGAICFGPRTECAFSNKCISKDDICDGVQDCPLGDDEVRCDCKKGKGCRDGESCELVTRRKFGLPGYGRSCQPVCGPGFTTTEGKCVDIDECRARTHRCARDEICENTEGSYECLCKPGYAKEPGSTNCTDINECARNLCKGPAHCQNLEGHFKCGCPPGEILYDTQPDSTVLHEPERYECYLEDQTCENCTIVNPDMLMDEESCKTDGSCVCPTGFNFDAKLLICNDIDECATQNHSCKAPLSCKNSIGSYECGCRSGFREISLAGKMVCEDIDECSEDPNICQFGCENTEGDYECTCLDGYEYNEKYKVCRLPDENAFFMISKDGKFFQKNLWTTTVAKYELFNHSCDHIDASKIFLMEQRNLRLIFVDANFSSIYVSEDDVPCRRIVEKQKNISTLQFDWFFGNIYWTDSYRLMVTNVENGFTKTLIKLDEPVKSLFLNPYDGHLFLKFPNKVARIGTNGLNFTDELSGVDSKFIDAWFYDTDYNDVLIQNKTKILTCRHSLDMCNALAVEVSPSQRLIDAFADVLVFQDKNSTVILVSKNGRHKRTIRFTNEAPVSMGIQVIHSHKHKGGGYKCDCAFFCLNGGMGSIPRCECPDDEGSCDPGAERRTQVKSESQPVFLFVFSLFIFVIGTTVGIYGGIIHWRYKRGFSSSSTSLTKNSGTGENEYVSIGSDKVQYSKRLLENEVPPDVLDDIGGNFGGI